VEVCIVCVLGVLCRVLVAFCFVGSLLVSMSYFFRVGDSLMLVLDGVSSSCSGCCFFFFSYSLAPDFYFWSCVYLFPRSGGERAYVWA